MRIKDLPTSNCDCEDCRKACSNKPGWFAPGEAEEAAKLKGMSLPDFFRAYLGIDYWVDSPIVYLLSPATVSMKTGTEFPHDPRGACIFLEGGRCSIYAARPAECRFSLHSSSLDEHQAMRRDGVVAAWREPGPMKQIEELLGLMGS